MPCGRGERAGGEGWHGGHQSQVFGVEAEKSHPWIPPQAGCHPSGVSGQLGGCWCGDIKGGELWVGVSAPSPASLPAGNREQAPCCSTGVIHSSKHSPCLQAESVWGRSLPFEDCFPSLGSLGHLISLSQLCSRCVPALPVLHRGGHAASPRTPPGPTCLGGEVTSPAPLSLPSPPPVTPPSWR